MLKLGRFGKLQVAQMLSASAAPSVKGEVLVSQGVMRNKITKICKTLSTGPGPLSPHCPHFIWEACCHCHSSRSTFRGDADIVLPSISRTGNW